MEYINQLGINAKNAQNSLASASTALKNEALTAISNALKANKTEILKANALDLENGKANGMSESLLDRLALSEKRIDDIADSVLEIVALPDPVGRIKDGSTRPNGLNIEKVAVPLGTVAVIYEARPNVTIVSPSNNTTRVITTVVGTPLKISQKRSINKSTLPPK